MSSLAIRRPIRRSSVAFGWVVAFAMPWWGLGCGSSQDADASRAAAERRSRQRQASQTDALLSSIASQLRTLPEAVQLDLMPPTVIVDSRRSTDGDDIEATIVRPEGVPREGPANLLRVPRRNARFRASDVRSGDTIKYFAKLGRETQERIRDAGDADIVVMEAVEFIVAQVLGENELLIVGGLAGEIDTPFRIEIWRNVDDRMREIGSQLAAYANRREPPIGWQPSPDEAELGQLQERINQWLRQNGGVRADRGEEITAWLATLPPELQTDERLAAVVDARRLAQGPFLPHDPRLIQQAVWARDIARRVRGDSPNAQRQATRLFDWVTRNVQLADETAPSASWQAMLYGRGSAADRAGVFAQLCRAVGLESVVFPVETEAGVHTLVGVLGKQGVYVYDPQLGLPIGSDPGGEEADLTLAELIADPGRLRAYDLEDAPYPVAAEALSAATPRIMAEPFSLSGRATALEQRLAGRDALTLTTDPSRSAKAIAAALPDAKPAVLWEHPYRTLREKLTTGRAARNNAVKAFLPFAWRPALWKGRVLTFRGAVEAVERSQDRLAESRNDFREAQKSFMDPTLRPKDSLLATLPSDTKRDIYTRAKAIATYWLGATALERGDYRNALSWLANDALSRPTAAPLSDGVGYTAARAYEALGELTAAAERFEASESPQRHGDRLRAARLRRQAVEEEVDSTGDAS